MVEDTSVKVIPFTRTGTQTTCRELIEALGRPGEVQTAFVIWRTEEDANGERQTHFQWSSEDTLATLGLLRYAEDVVLSYIRGEDRIEQR